MVLPHGAATATRLRVNLRQLLHQGRARLRPLGLGDAEMRRVLSNRISAAAAAAAAAAAFVGIIFRRAATRSYGSNSAAKLLIK